MTARTAYHLITTADERTWKFDRPVLFLGEWCRIYDRKHIWQGMDAIVAAPYGLGQAKKDADHAEARALEEEIFPHLCAVLNGYHGTSHGLRFWRIVLGHWFRRYVDVMLNRVRTLEKCLQTHQVSGTTGFEGNDYSLAQTDSDAAIWAFNDDRWNNELNVRILNLLDGISFPIELVAKDNEKSFRRSSLPLTLAPKRKALNWARRVTAEMTSQLVRSRDALIINSYLPKTQVVKLQLALGQCPQIWTSSALTLTNRPASRLRVTLTDQISDNSRNSLRRILHSMLFNLMPVCYLEGFDSVKQVAEQQSWPSDPKFVFTSNNFDRDEIFKSWLASKVESGYKYVAGQHGNNYGTHRYLNPSIEEITSSKFLTWGWTEGLPQHIPALILKTAGRKTERYNPAGGLLLIELCLDHRITTWDDTYEFDAYFKEQQLFISKLDTAVIDDLTIRLHNGYRQQNWNEISRWRDFDATLTIDTGRVPIGQLVLNSRLVVHSYDSTGMLETLSQNIPTLSFWQNDLDHLRESAKPYYQLLVDAGIVHLSPESAANTINEIWNSVEDWWRGRTVQDAIQIFCDKYAKSTRSPVKQLKRLLLEDGTEIQ